MFLGLKELKYNWLRSALLGGIAALLAFMVFMLLGLTRGLSEDSAAWMLNNPAATFVTTTDADGNFTRSFIGKDDVTAIRKANPDAAPFAQSFASFGVNSTASTQLGAVMMGLNKDSFLAPKVTEGQAMQGSGAVVDASLKKDGVNLGDTIILKPSGEKLKVVGFTEGARLNHQPVMFVTLDEWQSLNPRAGGTVSGVALEAENVSNLPEGLATQTRSEALQSLQGYKEEQGSLLMIQVFLVAVSALVMAVFFYVMTLQKTAQFGLLKAIGAGMRTLAGSLVAQVVVLTVLALAVAAGAMFGTTQVLPEGMPFALSWSAVGQASALLLVVSLLGSLLSLRTIAQADPLQALGQNG
ncbi:ABC transporter permease [Deinococcus sp. Marseille-Q6407]|uniref:ABC transporter permease n=1 Tax=Deinococcus sp. Marseille-Q6407 TaxID=2969223 RepID=UPI0021BF3F72|nr:ABC transporter permease [Deinococcus sp. Marseille-Q6407]